MRLTAPLFAAYFAACALTSGGGDADTQKAQAENLHGIVATMNRKTADAERHFSSAATLYKKTSNSFLLYRTLVNLSHVYSNLGYFADANLVLEKCLTHYKREKDDDTCVYVLQKLGFLARYSGDAKNADEYYRAALKIITDSGSKDKEDVAYAIWLIGCNHLEAGAPEKARKAFSEALTFDPSLRRITDEQEGLLLVSEGKHKQAKLLLDQAIKTTDPKHKPYEYANYKESISAIFLSNREYEQAKNCLNDSVRIRKELFGANHPLIARAVDRLAEVAAKAGNSADSERLRDQALDIRRKAWESQRKDFLKTIFESVE